MSSDGSFPHKRPDHDPRPPGDREGGRVLDFPTDEVSSPGAAAASDSVVPAGLWADDGAAGDAAESTERLLRPASERDAAEGKEELGQLVAFPQPAGTHKRRRPQAPAPGPSTKSQPRLLDASGTQPTQAPEPAAAVEAEEVPRPKFLASELLKQDWFPREPLSRTLRWGSLGVGVLGAGVALGLGGVRGEALGIGALFLLCAICGAVPVRAPVRGAALAVVGAAGAGWVSWMLTAAGDTVATPLLVACATLSASGLFFRAAHRTSTLARVLAGVGLVATLGWLLLTGGVDALVVESAAWQSWVDPLSRVLLGLITLLAVLSFLDPTGHGGAWVAGSAFLGWLVLGSLGALALAVWPLRGGAHGLDWGSSKLIALAALPLFSAVAASGLCQVWVLVSGRGRPLRRSEAAAA